MKIPFALLFLMLSFGYAFAASSSISVAVNTYAIGLSLLALTISIDVVAIGYIINKLFPRAGLSGWLVSEYWEIAKSAMIIVGAYAIVMFIGNIALLFAPPNSCNVVSSTGNFADIVGNVYQYAYCYLSNVESNISTASSALFGVSEGIGITRTSKVVLQDAVPLPPPIPIELGFGFSTKIFANQLLQKGASGAYLAMISDAYQFLVIPVALLVYIQEIGLGAIMMVGLDIMLPLGIVFRAFPFARSVGGTLVGIGFTMGIIYPAVLIMFNMPVWNATEQLVPQVSILTTGLASVLPAPFNILSAPLNLLLGTLALSGTALYVTFASFFNIYAFINFLFNFVFFFLIQFIIFLLDLIILFPLGDGIARTLGGTLRVSLGGKITLV